LSYTNLIKRIVNILQEADVRSTNQTLLKNMCVVHTFFNSDNLAIIQWCPRLRELLLLRS